MAILKMKYLEIAAPITESKELMDFLQMKSVVEIKKPEEIDGLENFETDGAVSSIAKCCDTAQTALKLIDKYAPEKGSLLDMLKDAPELTQSQFKDKSSKADEILSKCYEICACEKRIAECKASVIRLEASLEAVKPWLELDVPMQFKGTESTTAFIGTFPADYTKESLDIALAGCVSEDDKFESNVISHSRERTCVFILCHKDSAESVMNGLRTLGFAYPSDPTKHPPVVRFERIENQIKDLKQMSEENENKIKELAENRPDIKFICDYYEARKDRYEALKNIGVTDNVVFISGYVPEKNAQALVKEMSRKFTVAYELSDPGEDDDVPSAFENKPFAAAVEPITEMYSMPGKTDIDPNPVMSFFYYMLFGIMLSDAGYGLLMAIGCGIAKFGFKVKGKLKKTVDMYFWCGLATVFWGALFGGWFGDIISRVANDFFGISNLGQLVNETLGFTLFHGVYDAAGNVAHPGSIALWFEPVNDPTKLLLFSFLFGIVHLFFGVAASMVKMWKVGNKVGAICDGLPVFILIIGVAPIGANIIKTNCFGEPITTIAKWMALAGMVLIVATSGRDSKNIFGKLGLGLYGLYNAASGWLSDILSYSRLLALGLCTGVIANVINILGTIPDSKGAKLGLLIPVFIFGHIVNMAINLIGTYVHTNRLQYVEFFAKFYEGGGRAFTPLKQKSKYYNIKED